MPRTSYKPEEIVAKLRQVDVLISQGQSTADAIRQIGATERRAARGRTAISRASTPACVTSCSRERSSTACARPRSWSKAGGATTILNAPTLH